MRSWQELVRVRKEIDSLQKRLQKAHTQERCLVESCQQWLTANPGARPSRAEAVVLNTLLQNPELHNKQLASKLNLSIRTIKWHLSALMKKFKVESRHELVRLLASSATLPAQRRGSF